MKLTKAQPKEMIRETVREQLDGEEDKTAGSMKIWVIKSKRGRSIVGDSYGRSAEEAMQNLLDQKWRWKGTNVSTIEDLKKSSKAVPVENPEKWLWGRFGSHEMDSFKWRLEIAMKMGLVNSIEDLLK